MITETSASARRAPPSRALNASTFTPFARAASAARSTFGELPLVEWMMSRSLGPRQRLDLPREHVLEPEVVRRRGEERRVRGQRDGGIRAPVAHVAHDVFGREMLRVRRAAAVAAEEQRAAALHRLAHQRVRGVELGAERLAHFEREFGELAEAAGEVRADVRPSVQRARRAVMASSAPRGQRRRLRRPPPRTHR